MATLDELQAQLEELNRRVNEITAPPDDYYTHRFSGEEIDNAVGRVAATAGSGAITAGDVGAAPSGFGLGTIAKSLTAEDDLNNITQNGWYAFTEPPANAPTSEIDGWGSGYSYMEVAARNQDNLTQIIYASNSASVFGCGIKRYKSSGVWYPWEWVNPPMALGYEYKTIERYNKNPVYAKLVYAGSFPQNSYKDVQHGIQNIDFMISCIPTSYAADGSNTIPFRQNTIEGNAIEVFATRTIIRIVTNYAVNQLNTLYCLLKYTKTTD